MYAAPPRNVGWFCRFCALSETAASATQGRSWFALLASDVIDLDGDLATRLATSSTWSNCAVLWRVRPGEGARVELSGFPLFDGERNLAGFRGFGLVRSPENVGFPEREATQEDIVSTAPAVEAPEIEPPEAIATEESAPELQAERARLHRGIH